jgi:predicted HAD superfamily Cof-like phosphohydrolase
MVKKEKPLSDDEKLQLRKKEMVSESQEVLSAAVDSDSEMQQRVETQEDATKSAYEIAGMAQP